MTPVAGHVVMRFWCGHEIHLQNGDEPVSQCFICHPPDPRLPNPLLTSVGEFAGLHVVTDPRIPQGMPIIMKTPQGYVMATEADEPPAGWAWLDKERGLIEKL
jgi:hypothetical protein